MSAAESARPTVLSVRPWRPPGPGNTLGERLSEHGIALEAAPLQEVRLAAGAEVESAVRTIRAGEVEHVVLLHARAIDALARTARSIDRAAGVRRSLEELLATGAHVTVHALGRTTAETAIEHGLPPTHVVPGGTAELSAGLRAHIDAGSTTRVLLAGSPTTLAPLTEMLASTTAQVTAISAYALRPQPLPEDTLARLRAGRIAAVVVASIATAHLLAEALRPTPAYSTVPHVPVVAVGARVAAACREAGLAVVGVSARGAEASIADAVIHAMLNGHDASTPPSSEVPS